MLSAVGLVASQLEQAVLTPFSLISCQVPMPAWLRPVSSMCRDSSELTEFPMPENIHSSKNGIIAFALAMGGRATD